MNRSRTSFRLTLCPPQSAAARRVAALAVLSSLVATLGLAACTEDVGTSVRISLVYKDSWRIGSADVLAADSEKASPISRELLVLLPDDAAGEVMPFEVWGVRDGDRIAHGAAVALPRKGETVGATIVLERLPCGVFCTVGELRCEGDGIGACVRDAEDCLAWDQPDSCPAATPYCTAGECRVDCDDECAADEGTCVDSTTERLCGQFDADSCRDFGDNKACEPGQLCYGGRCAAPCAYDTPLTNLAVTDTAAAQSPSLVIDGAGTQHVVYSAQGTRDLMYLRRPESGDWTEPVMIGAQGDGPRLALDKGGALHLAFFSAGLRYGALAGNDTWTFADVELGAAIGRSHALAVDDDGVVHLVYHDATSAPSLLRHAFGAAPPFTLETVDTELGFGCDVVVAGTAVHVVSYSDTNNLWSSTKSSVTAAWASAMAIDLSDTERLPHTRAAIGVDRAGTLHVAYTDAYNNNAGPADDQLRYTSKSAVGTWTSSVIVDNPLIPTGALPGLAVDLFDGVHVTYRTDSASTALRYAYRPKGASSVWQLATQPAVTPGQEPTIGVDPTGLLHIVSAARPGGLVETTRPCQ